MNLVNLTRGIYRLSVCAVMIVITTCVMILVMKTTIKYVYDTQKHMQNDVERMEG